MRKRRLDVRWQKWHHVEPRILAAGHLTMISASASAPAADAAPSAASLYPTTALTASILLAFPEHPVEAQYNQDEENSGTSQCQMIEADVEDVLMCLRFDRFGLLNRAAIAGSH